MANTADNESGLVTDIQLDSLGKWYRHRATACVSTCCLKTP